MNHTRTDVQRTDDRRNRLAETTLELLAFDTQNPPGETRQAFDWLESAPSRNVVSRSIG